MKLIKNIDSEKQIENKEGQYLVTGWVADKSNEPLTLSVRLDGRVYEKADVEWLEREDVRERVSSLKNNPNKMGFQVMIRDFHDACLQCERIELFAQTETAGEVIFTKSVAEMRNRYEKEQLQYHIDLMELHSDEIVIQGWIVDADGNNSVSVLDENEHAVDAELKRLGRRDVADAFGLNPDGKWGFELRVLREEVKTSKMILSFSGGREVSRRETISLKKLSRKNSSFRKLLSMMTASNVKKGLRYIRRNGLRRFVRRVKLQLQGDRYDAWRKKHELSKQEIQSQRKRNFDYSPLISISIPLYNTPLPYLKDLLESVLSQTYANWELCLADGSTDNSVETFMKDYLGDRRIKYRRLDRNRGIAGNTTEAVDMAVGEFIMLTDHDDILEINALYEMVSALNEDRTIDIIYTDEDLVDETGTQFSSPRFKPDFNFDFLRSINYICHIFMVRKSIMDKVGAFREGYDGAQDYDLILRCCEQTQKIHHVPLILYHWRAHPASTAGNPESKMYAVEAGKKALEEHYQRMGIDAEVEYTGIFIMFKTIMKVHDMPKVSVLIPNKDHIDDLDKCISSIFNKTDYKNYEIIVIENNSEKQETFDYYDKIQKKHPNVRVVTWEHEFNYSKINNFGAQFAEGDYFILLNNDIEVISPSWMSEMLGYCQREDVGAVGAKLYYADDTVQHAGIVIGVGGFAGHILTGNGPDDVGYFGRLKAIQDVSAATAACLMVKRSVYEEIGGFDENFAVALNDVDLCLKIRAAGHLIVLNPWAELHHYESKSRGYEDTPDKRERFKREIKRFRDKWKDVLEQGDPYYNVNLTLDRGDCSVRRDNERFEIIEEIERESIQN